MMKLTLLFLSLSMSPASSSAAGSPVEQIVNLLKTLKAKTTGDSKVEQQIYDK